MGNEYADNHGERADKCDKKGQIENINSIAGGHFEAPVGQFASVHGDVNLNPPRSPEEAAFRARYMAKMQEAWDAEERDKEREKRDKERKEEEESLRIGLQIAALLVAMVFVVLMGIYFVETHSGSMESPFLP